MKFEADPSKAVANLQKHKVSFEEAASVFGDPMAFTFPDPEHSLGEERWLTFGQSGKLRILVVVYTYRRGKVRLISARPATRNERKIYEEG
jgi:uncharacterized protein